MSNSSPAPERIILSWSSGKDSAWALHELQQSSRFDVVGLITTFNEEAERVAMHAVREELVRHQADAAGLPLMRVGIPPNATNAQYETAFGDGLSQAAAELRCDSFAFGDLFLEDIRDYRCRHLDHYGFTAHFPLWGRDTGELAAAMQRGGLRAWLTCVDTEQLPAAMAGRAWDSSLLAELPAGADPCGENGEFHSFTWSGPMFRQDIPVKVGQKLDQGRFVFADLLSATGETP